MPDIAWGKKVSGPFKSKVLSISANLGCDPSHLMSAMAFESGESFFAVGQEQGERRDRPYSIHAEHRQVAGHHHGRPGRNERRRPARFVAKYLAPFKNKMTTVADVYMTILFPKAVGKPAGVRSVQEAVEAVQPE